MKKELFIVFISMLLLLPSCKKENLIDMGNTPFSDNPVFSVQGTLGEQTISMLAGVDGFVMKPEAVQEFGVNYFTGLLTNEDVSLELRINDGSLGIPFSVMDMHNYELSIADFQEAWISFNQSNFSNWQKIQNLSITIDGVDVGESASVYEPGFHTVCYNVTFLDGETREVCNELLLGYVDHGVFKLSKVGDVGSNTISVVAHELVSNSSISKVQWYLNGEAVGVADQLILGVNTGLHVVKAEVQFTNGITRAHSIIVDTQFEGRDMEDIYQFVSQQEIDKYLDYKFSLVYNKGGVLYEAINYDIYKSTISLNNISVYSKTDESTTVYKISGIFNGYFKNTVTQEVVPSQLNITYAIEVKL